MGKKMRTKKHPKRTERIPGISIGGRYREFPWFFASISSVKTNFAPYEYLRVLGNLKINKLLISSYDIEFGCVGQKQSVRDELARIRNDSNLVLMDSGNYERYWHKSAVWSRKKYESIVKRYPCDLAFSYDFPPFGKNPRGEAERIVKGVLKTQERVRDTSIIPIIHGSFKQLPSICSAVCKKLNPIMISVAERDLGHGILQRASTVNLIRKQLNKLRTYYPIHILGTGHPLSLLVLTIAGADSFDGVEWCQTSVNHSTAQLAHFQLREAVECQCPFCASNDTPYAVSTLAHNLIFYDNWMEKIKYLAGSKELIAELKPYFSQRFLEQLSPILRGD